MGIDATDTDEMVATASKIMAEAIESLRDRAAEIGDGAAQRLSRRHAERTRPVAVRPLATLGALENAGAVTVRWRHGLVGTRREPRRLSRSAAAGPDHHLPGSCAPAVEALQHGAVVDADPARPRPRGRHGAHPQAAAGGRRGAGGRRMTSAKREPCSDQSLARNDTMYGTASAGHLLVDAGIGRAVGAFGVPGLRHGHRSRTRSCDRRRAEAAGMRIAAIRRPGRRSATPRWRWFVAHCDEGSEALYRGEVDDARGVSGPGPRRLATARCPRIRSSPSALTASTTSVARSGARSHRGDRRASIPNSPGNARIWAVTGSRRRCSCCPRGCATAGWTPPTRRNWCGSTSTVGWTTASCAGRTSLPHRGAGRAVLRQGGVRARTASRRCRPLHVERDDHTVRVVLSGDSGPVEVVLAEEVVRAAPVDVLGEGVRPGAHLRAGVDDAELTAISPEA